MMGSFIIFGVILWLVVDDLRGPRRSQQPILRRTFQQQFDQDEDEHRRSIRRLR